MRLFSILGLWVFYVTTTTAKSVTPQSQKLMLILLDGFRWDYVDKFDLKNFKRFYTRGVKADKMTSVFPTLSYPNYYSLTTGLFTENHGMSMNDMWDRKTGDEFLLGANEESRHRHFWKDGWPLWVSVEKQGKVGYSFYWRHPEVNVHNTVPTWSVNFNVSQTIDMFQSAARDGLAVLKNGTADYVAIYFENVDNYGHYYGPDSMEMTGLLNQIDPIMKTLLDGIEGQKEEEKINLMVTSDHGMTSISRSRNINITSLLTPDLYDEIMENTAMTTIYLKNSNLEDTVFNLLKDVSPHMTVYRRKDIPERWHYKHGKYVPRIVCVAELGYVIHNPTRTEFHKVPDTDIDWKGTHGYDNAEDDMKGIFYAMGPYFKAGKSVKSVRIVDLYNVMCGILGITPRPNNGTIQTMNPLLKSSADNLSISSKIVGIFVIVLNVLHRVY